MSTIRFSLFHAKSMEYLGTFDTYYNAQKHAENKLNLVTCHYLIEEVACEPEPKDFETFEEYLNRLYSEKGN